MRQRVVRGRRGGRVHDGDIREDPLPSLQLKQAEARDLQTSLRVSVSGMCVTACRVLADLGGGRECHATPLLPPSLSSRQLCSREIQSDGRENSNKHHHLMGSAR